MIYITQLIYVMEGQEPVFDEFEGLVIPILKKYNGRILLRVRPSSQSIIENSLDVPYEIHLIEFKTQQDFNNFNQDENRKRSLHLKEKSIRTSLLIQGSRLA